MGLEMEESELDCPVMGVPMEELMRHFRASKRAVDRTLDTVLATLDTQGEMSTERVVQSLDGALQQLRKLQDRIGGLEAAEVNALDLVKRRVEHGLAGRQLLRERETEADQGKGRACDARGTQPAADGNWRRDDGSGPVEMSYAKWSELRTERFIVDFMLREGYWQSAKKLIERYRLAELVDEEVLTDSKRIADALARKDCSEALKWCADKRRKLDKMGSELPLRLHVQEFVELRRAGKTAEAIEYAKAHLFVEYAKLHSATATDDKSSLAREDKDNLIQKVMTLLAFPPDTNCQPYKELYSEERWSELISSFRVTYFELYGLTSSSLVEIALKVGMWSRKTRACYDPKSKNVNCPTCAAPFNEMAKQLPFCRNIHSRLVCAISGEVIDENNPPLVLENGNVYSESGLRSISRDGMVVDPLTGQNFEFPSDKISKVYVM